MSRDDLQSIFMLPDVWRAFFYRSKNVTLMCRETNEKINVICFSETAWHNVHDLCGACAIYDDFCHESSVLEFAQLSSQLMQESFN